MHEVGADIFLGVSSADGNDKDHVFVVQPAATQPIGVAGIPTFVVHPGGQFRNVVRWRVGFNLRDLAEIAHRVGGMARAAADAEDEQPAASLPEVREKVDCVLDCLLVQTAEESGWPRRGTAGRKS